MDTEGRRSWLRDGDPGKHISGAADVPADARTDTGAGTES
jgi:hypothetical protein